MASKTFKKRNNQEFTILVDEKYFFLLEQHCWFLRNGCAAATIKKDGKEESVYLHRIILEKSIRRHEQKTGKRARIIFSDGNKLNCKSNNIKIQRDFNKIKKKGTSKYRGVSFDKRNKKWRGKITINNNVIIDQLFDSEYEAWNAIDEKRKEFNKKNSKNQLKREMWLEKPNSKTQIPSKIYENFKEKIDDKFNRYFKLEKDFDCERAVETLNDICAI